VNRLNHRACLVLYTGIVLSFLFPFWFGEVVSPYNQFAHFAQTNDSSETRLENKKFSDFVKVFIPEISENINGTRSNWLVLWTNKNELGRPVSHLGGFSQAYVPSWLLSFLTNNPFVFITTLSLATIFLSGIFIMLFLKELKLSPIACLIAGLSLATSPFFMYWLTFPMFPVIFCWGFGSLYGIATLANKKNLTGLTVLAFSIYGLLMTAYPQGAVYQLYVVAGYCIFIAYTKSRLSWKDATIFMTLCVTAMLIGLMASVPAYLDLAHTADESLRLNTNVSFFTAALPKFINPLDAIMFFALSFIPELFGNPMEMAFPFKYNGSSITLLMLFLTSICLMTSFKRTWWWWLVILILFCMSFVEPFFVILVKYFGFNLSPASPVGFLLMPTIVIVAYGANSLILRLPNKKTDRAILVSSILVFITIVIAVCLGISQGIKIKWAVLVLTLILSGLFFAQYRKTYPFLLLITVLITIIISSFPLILRQNLDDIPVTSPLVEKIDENLPQGSRFAVAAPTVWVLEPNFNASVGLPSVHTYNSLSSRRYHKLIEALGSEMLTYGRHNLSISPDYNSSMFWMSNISLMLSKERLSHENLEYVGEESGVHLSRVNSRMGNSLQVLVPDTIELKNGSMEIGDPRLLEIHTPSKLLDFGDVLEFKLDSTKSSIFILSQKFHRDWAASVSKKGEWVPANTIDVNGVFQGVLLPSNVDMVRLEFKPFVRYMFISHIFWLLLFTVLVISIFRNKRKNQCEEVRV
jgi:hypothetical protein